MDKKSGIAAVVMTALVGGLSLVGAHADESETSKEASKTCYQLSRDGVSWSRTPELMCVAAKNGNSYEITLKMNEIGRDKIIAQLNFSLLRQTACLYCNDKYYGVANPSNSTFNAFAIQFNGKYDPKSGSEQGTVSLGPVKLYYKSAQ